jgi:hypothetical protein
MPVSAPTNCVEPAHGCADAPAHTAVSTTPLLPTSLTNCFAQSWAARRVWKRADRLSAGQPATRYRLLRRSPTVLSAGGGGGTSSDARSGDSFGELALLDGGARDATAEAVAPCQLSCCAA